MMKTTKLKLKMINVAIGDGLLAMVDVVGGWMDSVGKKKKRAGHM